MGMVKCRFLEEKEFSLGQKGKNNIYIYVCVYIYIYIPGWKGPQMAVD